MRRIVLLLPLCLLLGLAVQAQEWSEIHSPNLVMITNVEPHRAQDSMWRMEQMRTAFGRLLNRTKVNRNKPLVIFGLQNQAEVRSLVGDAKLIPGGYALASQDRNFLVIDLSATDTTGVDRAYALLMLDANYPRTQPWFDEGIAAYIAGLSTAPKQSDLHPTPEILQLLQSGGLVPMARLISADAKDTPQFRATSWLFLRWLIDNGQLDNAAIYFNQVMNRRVPPVQAFQQAFGRTPEQFDPLLAKYRPQALASKKIDLSTDLDPRTFTVSKLTDTTVRALQAQLRLEIPSLQDRAAADLRQMLAQEPDNVEVNRGLGIYYLHFGDMKNSIDYIRRAIEIKDNDALMHYLVAVWRNRGSREGIQVDSEGPTIQMQVERCIELDPEFAAAYILLADAQVATNHADRGLQTIRKGIALSPRDESFLLTFASIQLASGKYDEARNLLTFLQAGTDSDIAKRAGEMLISAKRLTKSQQHWAEQGMTYTDPTDPRWKPKKPTAGDAANLDQPETPKAPDKPDPRKIQYLKGTLVDVQCPESSNAATLNIFAARKKWAIQIPDRTRALLIGADSFQCSWKDVSVSVNYRASGPEKGDLVSLEID